MTIIHFNKHQRDDTKLIYTNNWFDRNVNTTMKFLSEHVKTLKDPINVLEIGSHEGRSTVWMLHNLCINPSSILISIDPYFTNDVTTPVDNNTKLLFTNNIEFSGKGDQIIQYRDLSKNVLPQLDIKFDIIYIDGSHLFEDVLIDIEYSYKIIKNNGLILIDDYGSSTPDISKAVNLFMSKNPDLKIIIKEYQILLQKITI